MNKLYKSLVLFLFIFYGCKGGKIENSKSFDFLEKEVHFPDYYESYDRRRFEKEMEIQNVGPGFIHKSDLYLKDKNSSNFIMVTARRFNKKEKDYLEFSDLYKLKYRLIELEQGRNLVWKDKFFNKKQGCVLFAYEFDYSDTYYCHIRKLVFEDYILNLSLFSTDRDIKKIDDFRKFLEYNVDKSLFNNFNTSKMASGYLRDHFGM
jgi:hypothetical protein